MTQNIDPGNIHSRVNVVNRQEEGGSLSHILTQILIYWFGEHYSIRVSITVIEQCEVFI
jgi:hypothetical protein